jgi:hypothetical protein
VPEIFISGLVVAPCQAGIGAGFKLIGKCPTGWPFPSVRFLSVTDTLSFVASGREPAHEL